MIDRIILGAEIGSRAHGLNLESSDHDTMNVCIEPIALAMGSAAPFEQIVKQGPEEDSTTYSLRKFVRLALKGNPTVTTLFYAPATTLSSVGQELRDMAPMFLSKQQGRAHLGYLHAQRQRMLGERGNGGHGSPRNALVEKFGYDTKYAMHMLRLGMQGVELLKTGQMRIPMSFDHQMYLKLVRQGGMTQHTVLTYTGELEAELRDLIDASPYPEMPATGEIDRWLTRAYLETWTRDAYAAATRPDISKWEGSATGDIR